MELGIERPKNGKFVCKVERLPISRKVSGESACARMGWRGGASPSHACWREQASKGGALTLPRRATRRVALLTPRFASCILPPSPPFRVLQPRLFGPPHTWRCSPRASCQAWAFSPSPAANRGRHPASFARRPPKGAERAHRLHVWPPPHSGAWPPRPVIKCDNMLQPRAARWRAQA